MYEIRIYTDTAIAVSVYILFVHQYNQKEKTMEITLNEYQLAFIDADVFIRAALDTLPETDYAEVVNSSNIHPVINFNDAPSDKLIIAIMMWIMNECNLRKSSIDSTAGDVTITRSRVDKAYVYHTRISLEKDEIRRNNTLSCFIDYEDIAGRSLLEYTRVFDPVVVAYLTYYSKRDTKTHHKLSFLLTAKPTANHKKNTIREYIDKHRVPEILEKTVSPSKVH